MTKKYKNITVKNVTKYLLAVFATPILIFLAGNGDVSFDTYLDLYLNTLFDFPVYCTLGIVLFILSSIYFFKKPCQRTYFFVVFTANVWLGITGLFIIGQLVVYLCV